MIVGGVLAWLIAATTVVLPYDEAFVGMTRAEFAGLNPHLLPFMAHDSRGSGTAIGTPPALADSTAQMPGRV
jgi:hypothetical protein